MTIFSTNYDANNFAPLPSEETYCCRSYGVVGSSRRFYRSIVQLVFFKPPELGYASCIIGSRTTGGFGFPKGCFFSDWIHRLNGLRGGRRHRRGYRLPDRQFRLGRRLCLLDSRRHHCCSHDDAYVESHNDEFSFLNVQPLMTFHLRQLARLVMSCLHRHRCLAGTLPA